MKFIDEGVDDKPLFIRRKIGEKRESVSLVRLYKNLRKFLFCEKCPSVKELSELSEAMQRGMLEVQKKKRKILMKRAGKMSQKGGKKIW